MAGRNSYPGRLRAKNLLASPARVARSLQDSLDSSPISLSAALMKRYQEFHILADSSFSTAVSDDEEDEGQLEKTAGSDSSLSLPVVTSSTTFIMDKKYRPRYSFLTTEQSSTAASDEELDEPTAKSANDKAVIDDLKKQLAQKTAENEKLAEETADACKKFETLAFEQEQRLAADEMQSEMMNWMGNKWKAAEEEKIKAEKEVAERDRLIEQLEKMLEEQPSQSTASPNWPQEMEDEKKEGLAAADKFDSDLQGDPSVVYSIQTCLDAMKMVEETQLELDEARDTIQELEKAVRAGNLDKEILRHSVKHWHAVAIKLLDNVELVKEQVWADGETEDDGEIVDKMELIERVLLAIIEEMKNHAFFIEDF